MNKMTLEDIEQRSKKIEQQLEEISSDRQLLEKKKVEMIEQVRDSARPIRELQMLPFSIADEEQHLEILKGIDSLDEVVEDWADERDAALKRRERALEDERDSLHLEYTKRLAEEGEE